ncbi:hypothetical protein Vretimale_783 [Volvox reticuliferus]|uniref:Uncharacterized protein n=1 Tax=Volvox reticuliferus TaxID=1737510 RepID=A0A8J4D2M2_9CHLO|nr:hypothetical protein Vretifemale_2083 [Volvox reticuliferus]GIL94558.1 hypothetical protein Vretimale_783 [Volvox reticuliferus]
MAALAREGFLVTSQQPLCGPSSPLPLFSVKKLAAVAQLLRFSLLLPAAADGGVKMQVVMVLSGKEIFIRGAACSNGEGSSCWLQLTAESSASGTGVGVRDDLPDNHDAAFVGGGNAEASVKGMAVIMALLYCCAVLYGTLWRPSSYCCSGRCLLPPVGVVMQ